MLSQKDRVQIEKKGISFKDIEEQLEHFRRGFPFARLVRPATPDDGVILFTDPQRDHWISIYLKEAPLLRISKFVPASGAASRMFKHLFEFQDTLVKKNLPDSWKTDSGFRFASCFFSNLTLFAFYPELRNSLAKSGIITNQAGEPDDMAIILDHLLGESGLNYAGLPKALIAFHSYPEGPRTALEEQLVEASLYTTDKDHITRIHFTVSPEHIGKFDEKINSVRTRYETLHGTKLEISFSVQRSSTDTIAADENNSPFRTSDGSLLFRPAGHGALLPNLQEQAGDLIFIKNIDNVVPDHLKSETIDYKMILGGLLIHLRSRIFDFLKKVELGNLIDEEIREMAAFSKSNDLLTLPEGFGGLSLESQIAYLKGRLNRPIRVCGMVRNSGEPGGGPFWVQDNDGNVSLQIVESSQVDMQDEAQRLIFQSSTHFNPVDLVCCTIDHNGNPFKLKDFVDESTGFISPKSSEGRTLKAQELPGLWNGSMAGWITVFVEIPLTTFNPVKTINDLLRDEHK